MNLFENLQLMKESDVSHTKVINVKNKLKLESTNKLWDKFNEQFNGFVPIEDLMNYLSLDQFGEFVQWCRYDAGIDYDYNKKYYNWDKALDDLDEISESHNIYSISIDNIFNFFTNTDLEDFWNWIEKEYDLEDKDLEEATSGIGAGSYTTKAIDIIPAGLKKVKEYSYNKYLERVMNETSNVKLVNLLHEVRENKNLKYKDKKKLENEIRTKVRNIKIEAITKFYGKELTDDEIKKAINVAKENPDAVGYMDPNECASPFTYNGTTYYTIGEGKEIIFDGKYSVVYLTVDEELNRYLSYFEVSYEDEGDGKSGPQELTMDFVSDVPFKVVEV